MIVFLITFLGIDGEPMVRVRQGGVFDRREISIILVIFFIAFIVRLVWALSCKIIPDAGDQCFFNRFALHFINGEGLFNFGNFRTPAYPVFIGFCYKIFGRNNYAAVFIAQSILSAATVLLTYLLGRNIFGRISAIIAAAVSVFYLDFILYNINFATETLTLFLIVWAVYCLSRKNTLLTAVVPGFLFGLASLARPPASFFVPGILLGFLSDHRVHLRLRMQKIVLFLVVYLFTLSPWIVGNVVKTRRLVLLADFNGGFTFYSGTNPDANGGFVAPSVLRLKQGSRFEDNFWREGFLFIRHEPLAYGRLLLLKLSRFFSANNDVYMYKYYLFPTQEVNYMRNSDYSYMNKGLFPPHAEVLSSFQIRIRHIILGLTYIVNMLIFLFFFVTFFYKDKENHRMVLFPIFSYVLIILLFFLVLNRYRLLCMPFFILFAAEGVMLIRPLGVLLRNGDIRRARFRTVLFVICALVIVLNYIYSLPFMFSHTNVFEYW